MGDGPAGYDREWTSRLGIYSRLRVGYTHERGRVTRFVVQIEYDWGTHWCEVVRIDHDETGVLGHDVSTEGVHLDVYRDGVKWRTEDLLPPTAAGRAFTFAEAHMTQHAQRYVERFDTWHGIDQESR